MKGKYVIIRSTNAGVFFGKVVEKEPHGNAFRVILDECRRIHYWSGANSCSGLALAGLNIAKSRVADATTGHEICEVIEIIPCTEAAVNNLKEAGWNA